MTSPEAQEREPRVIAGRYRLVRVVGRGGMGEVHLAEDLTLGREVALKFLRSEVVSEPGFMERFTREAQALARLRHPGVIRVYDFLTPPEGGAYLVLEYVPGSSLADEIYIAGRMPWRRCAQIGAAVCDALEAAHGANVIHRDIKPSNILIEPDGAVRVADFGIARLTDASMTQSGLMIGTPGYMAPELTRGRRASAMTDVYSLTAVLFEMACGRPPFVTEEPNSPAVAFMHVIEPVPDPWDEFPDLDAAARDILMRGLQKEPDDRFPSAAELGRALRASAGIAPPPNEATEPATPARAGGARPPLAVPPPTTLFGDGEGLLTEPAEVALAAGIAPAQSPVGDRIGGDPQGTPRPGPGRPAEQRAPKGDTPPTVAPGDRPQGGTASSRKALVVTAGLLAGVGGVAGAAIGLGGAPETPEPTVIATKTLTAPAATLRYPADWSAANPNRGELRGLGLRTPRAVGPAASENSVALTIGMTTATGERLLRQEFTRRVGERLPQATGVRLGGTAALLYAGIPVTDPAGRLLSVYVAPTTAGVLTIACHAPESAFPAHSAACARAVSTLRLRAGTRAYPLGVDTAYQRFLNTELRRFGNERTQALTALGDATSRAAQAGAAGDVSAAFAGLRNRITARPVSPQIAEARSGLSRAAGTAARAYSELSGASGSTGSWNAARREASGAETAFRASLAEFAEAGHLTVP